MLTHEDLLLNLRLLPPNAPPPFDVIKELDGLIVELQGQKNQDLNVEVAILVLQSLRHLVEMGQRSSTLPLMTGFDPPQPGDDAWPFWADFTGIITVPGDNDPAYDPVGLRMDYDSAYDEKA